MIERTDKNLKRIVIIGLDDSRNITEDVLTAGYLDVGMGAIAVQQEDAQIIFPFSSIKGCRLEYESKDRGQED